MFQRNVLSPSSEFIKLADHEDEGTKLI